MGVQRKINFIKKNLISLINGSRQESKIFNIPVFSPPYKCMKTCINNSTIP